MAVKNSQKEATDNLQKAINKIVKWMQDWKIKLNQQKSTHITFTLRRIEEGHSLYIDGQKIPHSDTAKYLGIHLDTRLTWKHHIRKKAEQIRHKIRHKIRQMHWLIGRKSKLELYHKRLLYVMILRPIWTYGIQIWGSTSDTNCMIVQRLQNVIIRTITNARWYQKNEDLHKDLNLRNVDEIIKEHALRHKKRLHEHINAEAFQLLDTEGNLRRLKRRKPLDLVTQ